MSRLSELEGAVLGLIWSDGPMTAYAVQREFLHSPSSHFTGSAGAIYPLVERLQKSGLIKATRQSTGRRQSKSLETTESGGEALLSWVMATEDWMASVEFDPIRTRVFFLSRLPAARREPFLRDALDRTEVKIASARQYVRECSEGRDEWKTWAARGALAVLRARRSWLREILRTEY